MEFLFFFTCWQQTLVYFLYVTRVLNYILNVLLFLVVYTYLLGFMNLIIRRATEFRLLYLMCK